MRGGQRFRRQNPLLRLSNSQMLARILRLCYYDIIPGTPGGMQVESYQVFRVDQQGSMSMTVAAKEASSLFIQGAVGDTYEVAVQTRFANGAGSRLSLWAPSVTMPTKVPAQMPGPTLQLDGMRLCLCLGVCVCV